jgi:hypothetical protein
LIVVLTTYGTIALEYKKLVAWENEDEATRDPDPQLVLLGDESKWYRVVLDGRLPMGWVGSKVAQQCSNVAT